MADYGIQLYSVRDIAPKDLRGTLEKVAKMGYKTVEFAGFFGNPSSEVKAWLDEYGLIPIGTHTGWQELENNFNQTVKYHQSIGCKNIIVPGAPLSTAGEIATMANKFNEWDKLLKAEGITLHYHNHSQEFMPNKDGLIADYELKVRTDICFEIDTYWAYVAGRDPIEELNKFGDRVKLIHLKDGDRKGTGKSLGLGTAPVKAVLDLAIKTGRGIVVESEGLDPTGAEEVERCIDFLKAQNK